MNTEAPRHTDPTKDISYSPWSHKESYTTETHTHRHTHTQTHTHTGKMPPRQRGQVGSVLSGRRISN